MGDRDKIYLWKELTRTIDESDSTAAFCLCQRWILKDALDLLKEQESVIEALKSDLNETLAVLGEQPEIVRCRDCKHWRTNTEFCMRWSVANVAHHTPPNWFCADGERKSNGKDNEN